MKIICTLLLLANISCFSQEYVKNTIPNINTSQSEDDELPYEIVIKKNNSYSAGTINDIPVPVMTSFNGNYPNSMNISWFIDDKATTIYFTHDDRIMIVKYKNDGNVLLTKKTYPALKLADDVARFINSEIPAGFITRYVSEAESENVHQYEVNIARDKQWQIIKISQDKEGKLQVISRKSFSSTLQ